MNNKSKISLWRWRIYRVNHTLSSFAWLINKSPAQLSNWISFKTEPKASTVDLVENELSKLEAEHGTN